MALNEYTFLNFVLSFMVIMAVVNEGKLKIKIFQGKDNEIIVKPSAGNLFYWIISMFTIDIVFLFIPTDLFTILKGMPLEAIIGWLIFIYTGLYCGILLLFYPIFRDRLSFTFTKSSLMLENTSPISLIKWRTKKRRINPSTPLRFQALKRRIYLNQHGSVKEFYSRWPSDDVGLKKLVRVLNTIATNHGVALSESIDIVKTIKEEVDFESYHPKEHETFEREQILWKGNPNQDYIKKTIILEAWITLILSFIAILLIILIPIIWPLIVVYFEDMYIAILIFTILYFIIAPMFIIWGFRDIILKLWHKNTNYIITRSKITSIRGKERIDVRFKDIDFITLTQESWLEAKYGHGSIATIRIYCNLKKKIQLWGVPDYVYLRNLIYEKMAEPLEVRES